MFNKIKHNLGQVAYTLLTIALLCSVIITMISYVYTFSEERALEQLHIDTKQIKTDINHQIKSDRENLITMANFASKLYSDGESFDIMLQSFEEIGLISDIGILMPDNTFITKKGAIKNIGGISFEDEAKKGEYVSGKEKDITNAEREIVRSAVPIEVDGKTVAMLYGAIELDDFVERYIEDVRTANADLFVIEANSGNYLIDTKRSELGNITALTSRKFNGDFTYRRMITELSMGISGYSSFMSQRDSEYVYVHYSPLEISDWQIMLAKSENIVFADARRIGFILAVMFFAAVIIMFIYLVLTVGTIKRKTKAGIFASELRKRLLEQSRHSDTVADALERITKFAKSRSTFFVNSHGDAFNNIEPAQAHKLLENEDREYFIRKLSNYISGQKTEQGAFVQVVKLTLNAKLKEEMHDLYEFFVLHDIYSVRFAGIIDSNGTMSILGSVNAKNSLVEVLFKDVAVCFSMAVHNKKHLVKTEKMALTDSLTGLENRMAYKEALKHLSEQNKEQLACIYIDVNELHYFNNKYGHSAGDQMLVYISEILVKEFSQDSHIYRMGGDEFLIFAENVAPDVLEQRIKISKQQIEEMKYHISVGVKYAEENMGIEEMVIEAEKEMYADKALYYQTKGIDNSKMLAKKDIYAVTTGLEEVDASLSIMSQRFPGVYFVSLEKDEAFRVLAPSYFLALEEENHSFSQVMEKYIHDVVKAEYQRSMLSLLDYNELAKQLKNGIVPRQAYIKHDDEKIVLSIYGISKPDDTIDAVWIFEREDD